MFHANCLQTLHEMLSETICMKCQSLFSGKKEKYFKMLFAEIFTKSAKRSD